MKDPLEIEEVEWSFLPLTWDEVEIFALTKAFQIKGIGSAYLVIFHQSVVIRVRITIKPIIAAMLQKKKPKSFGYEHVEKNVKQFLAGQM